MSKTRSEFLYSLGEKLIFGLLATILTFLVIEHVRASLAAENNLRQRIVESASIVSQHYAASAKETMQHLQEMQVGLSKLHHAGDDVLMQDEETRSRVSSEAIRVVVGLNEMSYLAGNNTSRFDNVISSMYEIQQELKRSTPDTQSLMSKVDDSITAIAHYTNDDLREIVRREIEAVGERRAPWELEGFWYLGAALAVCLFGIGLVYVRLPR